MPLTEEEATKIKEHLLQQLGNFPEEKREIIQKSVEEMTPIQVETFVKQNQLTHLGNQCIFCSIIAGKTPSVKIGENLENIAILEINPLSKGHTLVLPKEHSQGLLNSTKELATETMEKLKEKLEPKEVEIKETSIMEHPVIELIPIYGDEKERKQATVQELKEIQEELKKPTKIIEEIKPKEIEGLPQLKPRIPNFIL